MRTVELSDGKTATFHEWAHEAFVIRESPLVGGHPGGQIAHTYAIIEHDDGTITLERPENIKFIKVTEIKLDTEKIAKHVTREFYKRD